MPVAMTTFVQFAGASFLLGGALVLVGCGGGGSPLPTPTPGPTTTPTPVPTSNGSGPIASGQMVFVSTRNGASEIFKADSNGSNPVRLINLAPQGITNIQKPSVSPDGARIVFQFGNPATGTGTDNLEIGLVNTDGTGLQQLTTDSTTAGRPDDYNPVFSPNNQFIFWTSKRQTTTSDQVPHIWRMDASAGNTGKNQNVFIAAPSAYPSFDRTGNSLAYAALGQSYAVAIQPLTGSAITSGSTPTTIGQNIAGNAVFDIALSRDGARVAFSTAASGTAPSSNAASNVAAGLNIFSVASNTSVGSATLTTTSNGGAAWSRDSNTLFFDGAGGNSASRQIFALPSPFSTPSAVTTSAQGASYSPAFLPGN